jgi:hypothetical protein
MTRKQKPKVEIELDRDDPPPDDFHQVRIFCFSKIQFY